MTRFRATNLAVVAIVIAAAAVAAWQLARVLQAAMGINDSAQAIAESGRGINLATDSVVQLRRTNATARSILESARPLDERLARVVDEATGIDSVAGSINVHAGQIDSTAADIDSTATRIDSIVVRTDSRAARIDSTAADISAIAHSIDVTARAIDALATVINGNAAGILDIARGIDRDVRLINVNLADSIDITGAVNRDTGHIVGDAVGAHDTSACIDERTDAIGLLPDDGTGGLPDGTGEPPRTGDRREEEDGHCQGRDNRPRRER